MNSKFTTIIAVAALCAAVSAVSCGKDKNSNSSDVVLDIKTTTVSAESTTDVTTTSAVTTTKAKVTTTTAKTTAAIVEEETTPVAVETPEEPEPAEEEPEYIEEEPEEAYEEPQEEQPAAETPSNNNTTFTFSNIDQPISSITSILGAGAQSTVPSCIPKGDGSDSNTVYSYSGLDVLTYTMGGAEYVGEIDITGGSFATDKGIKVGSSRAEVTAAYPGAGSSGSDLFADSGNQEIYFYMSGDTVSKITIS